VRCLSITKSQLLKESVENLAWFRENYKNIKKECNNQWVIIQNRQIVAKGSTYDEIANLLNEKSKKSAIVEFIDSKQLAMFF
jgi:H2-forming N5,N10-methylenetetrahydromethanopterin dehydrogenase-like enzyme